MITYPPKAALLDYQGRIIVILPGYRVTSSFEFLVKKHGVWHDFGPEFPFFFTKKTPINGEFFQARRASYPTNSCFLHKLGG